MSFFRFSAVCILLISMSPLAKSQLLVSGGSLIVESGARIEVKGNMTCSNDISGDGKIVLSGTSLQTIDMGGKTIPNLEINNGNNVSLASGLVIGNSLIFTNGKIILGDHNLSLSSTSGVSGAGASKFAETNGAGQVFRELAFDINNVEIPVGVGADYRPVFVNSSASSYNNAKLGVKALAIADPNKPSMVNDYLSACWPVTLTGVTGSVTVQGQYIDGTDVTGTESNLRGYFYNGTDWTSAGSLQDAASNKVGMPITAASGTLYGMNKFIYAGARAFLQGAYNAGTGLMNESLRTPNLYIPASDPYRSSPYNTSFTHVNNNSTETISGSPFATQASAADNIVDWVFLELRNTNASPGNTILATRSALIQRDGDIVDVDGISPVLFNNIADGNYAITVRHRNHLSMSLSPTAGFASLAETKSQAFGTNVMDLRTAPGNKLYGTSAGYTTASHPSLGTVNLLWAGNANSNNICKYSGAGNDRAVILLSLNSNELGLLNGYNSSDLNMNGSVKYSGAGNDRAFLLSSVLGGNELGLKTEQRPN